MRKRAALSLPTVNRGRRRRELEGSINVRQALTKNNFSNYSLCNLLPSKKVSSLRPGDGSRPSRPSPHPAQSAGPRAHTPLALFGDPRRGKSLPAGRPQAAPPVPPELGRLGAARRPPRPPPQPTGRLPRTRRRCEALSLGRPQGAQRPARPTARRDSQSVPSHALRHAPRHAMSRHAPAPPAGPRAHARTRARCGRRLLSRDALSVVFSANLSHARTAEVLSTLTFQMLSGETSVRFEPWSHRKSLWRRAKERGRCGSARTLA